MNHDTPATLKLVSAVDNLLNELARRGDSLDSLDDCYYALQEWADENAPTQPTFTVFFPKDWECLDLCEEHIDHWLWRENPFTRWSVLVSPIDEADQRQCEVLL